LLAAGGDSGGILLWDISTAPPLGPPIDPAQGQLRHVIFSADGKRLLTSGTDGPMASGFRDAGAVGSGIGPTPQRRQNSFVH
jgi:WD40 repeat protein